MKKIFSILITAALIACSLTTAFAKSYSDDKPGKTGGVLISQGASSENFLSESAGEESPTLPEYYSSVDMGYVTSVKNQSLQNTCVIFSSTAAMETALLKNGYGEYDLSEEYGNYWASVRNDGTGWLRDRVNKGTYPYAGCGYLTAGGVIPESELPYMSRTEEYFEDLNITDPLFYAGGVTFLSGDNVTAESFKNLIMEDGGIVASFAPVSDFMNYDTSSYFCSKELTTEQLSASGHSVFVVGWDDNYSRENFLPDCQPQNDGAWLIKNSWGEGNFDYIWISYEDLYLGNDIFGGIFAVNDVIKNHTCNELLSVDAYGSIYDMCFTSDDVENTKDVTFINTFEFSKKMPSISNVEFSTDNVGGDYEIYYIPTENGIPADNEALWTELASGEITYTGIHNIAFKPYTVPSSQGAIGVRIISSDEAPAAIGCCEWYGDLDTDTFLFLPRTLDNRSFVHSGGTSFSLTDYYSSYGDDIGGNFTVRVLANVQLGDVNTDGEINISDVTVIQKYCAGFISLTDEQADIADTDGNKINNIDDATTLQKYIADIITL